jgi:hypothetical protein
MHGRSAPIVGVAGSQAQTEDAGFTLISICVHVPIVHTFAPSINVVVAGVVVLVLNVLAIACTVEGTVQVNVVVPFVNLRME